MLLVLSFEVLGYAIRGGDTDFWHCDGMILFIYFYYYEWTIDFRPPPMKNNKLFLFQCVLSRLHI
jgi:hypothetical protein